MAGSMATPTLPDWAQGTRSEERRERSHCLPALITTLRLQIGGTERERERISQCRCHLGVIGTIQDQ